MVVIVVYGGADGDKTAGGTVSTQLVMGYRGWRDIQGMPCHNWKGNRYGDGFWLIAK